MVKLVDTLVSGTSDRKVVQVRVLFWALSENQKPVKISFLAGFFFKFPPLLKFFASCCKKSSPWFVNHELYSGPIVF